MSERVALLCFFFAGASFCFCFRFALPFPFCLSASCFCRESSDGVEPFSALSAAAVLASRFLARSAALCARADSSFLLLLSRACLLGSPRRLLPRLLNRADVFGCILKGSNC